MRGALKKRQALRWIWGTVPLALLGCGDGFQAVKPDPEQIMSISNQRLASPEAAPGPAQPTPLPMEPAREGELEPFIEPEAESTTLPPRRLEGDSKLTPFGTPQPVDPNIPPFTAFGRLEYTKGGQNWYCSGQLVGATGDVLMTAAHCVYDTKTDLWASNFTFKLGYANGGYREIFDWECTAIFTGWAQNLYRKDYAFIKLRGSGDDALGMRTGLPVQVWNSVGYPGNYAGGGQLYRVNGNRGRMRQGTVEMTGNPFGGGSSGGAWIDGNFVIGLNSYGIDGIPNSMWGPLFDGQTTRLYEHVRRGCQHDVVPLGADIKISSYDKDKAYIETNPAIVEYGPRIIARRSDACPCEGAEEIFLESAGEDSYLAEIGYSGSSGNPPEVHAADDFSDAGRARQAEIRRLQPWWTRGKPLPRRHALSRFSLRGGQWDWWTPPRRVLCRRSRQSFAPISASTIQAAAIASR